MGRLRPTAPGCGLDVLHSQITCARSLGGRRRRRRRQLVGVTTDYPSLPAIAHARALASCFQRSISTAPWLSSRLPTFSLLEWCPPARRRGRQGLPAPRQAMRTTLAYLCALCAALRVAAAVGPLRPSELFMPHERQLALLPGWEIHGVVIAEHSGVNSSSACVEHCRAALPAGCAFSSFCEDQVRDGRPPEARAGGHATSPAAARQPQDGLPHVTRSSGGLPAAPSLLAGRLQRRLPGPDGTGRLLAAVAELHAAGGAQSGAGRGIRCACATSVRGKGKGPAAVGLAAALACTVRHLLAASIAHRSFQDAVACWGARPKAERHRPFPELPPSLLWCALPAGFPVHRFPGPIMEAFPTYLAEAILGADFPCVWPGGAGCHWIPCPSARLPAALPLANFAAEGQQQRELHLLQRAQPSAGLLHGVVSAGLSSPLPSCLLPAAAPQAPNRRWRAFARSPASSAPSPTASAWARPA